MQVIVRVDTSFGQSIVARLKAGLHETVMQSHEEVQRMTDAERQESIRRAAAESTEIAKRSIPKNSSDSSGGDA